jgi:aldehyde dehydrogenase (NAD+)
MWRLRARKTPELQGFAMDNQDKFYIGGEWVAPGGRDRLEVINPATEEAVAAISLGTADDVDTAVAAARGAFDSYARTSREERLDLLGAIASVYKRRMGEMAETISMEMGAPMTLARKAHAPAGLGHLMTMIDILKGFDFEEKLGTSQVVKEPIGVCGMITPWNWPINQITCKVVPALAAGCTMVLKPSEIAPLSGLLFAEILHEAGVPAGVFNLVNGDGPGVGTAISAHRDIDMVSFTGSTRAGIDVAMKAAPTVKRVAQELGGKTANILLDDVDWEQAVRSGAIGCFGNTGQTCVAPTRMLVPHEKMDEAARLAAAAAEGFRVGDPGSEDTQMGPAVSQAQWEKIQNLIQVGIDEGAELAAGGVGKPDGLNRGYYVRPTVFARVANDMTIAREEIFGPVLSIIGYENEEDAIAIANDTVYGLAGNVSSSDHGRACRVARRLQAGRIVVNYAPPDRNAPFGGYKQSGNGREWGRYGFEEFLEVKAIIGHNAG